MVREIITGIRVSLVIWVLTGIIYPLLMVAVGQILFPYQANGSLINSPNSPTPVGSALIGQPFSQDKYFWSRPSTVSYSTADPKNDKDNILQTGVSGASNLAPSNSQELLKDNRKPDDPDLLKRIRGDINKLKAAGIQPTADLVYTSGSGLDPHISEESAQAQINRVAKARGINPNQVELILSKHIDSRFLGIFGEPGVNVLQLNLDLDRIKTAPPS